MALHSLADETFFGGSAGGGKSDLLLGTALTQYSRSVIFRREYKQLEGLRERSQEIYSPFGRFNGSKELWRLHYKGRPITVEFGAVQLVGNEKRYQGRAHALKGFDEITHFAKVQYDFLKGWNRTADPTERPRIICTGNPPTDAEGDWVISYWGPWLDPAHPNPAKSGELRWFATIDGKDVELEDGKPFFIPGEADAIQPKSRTFIRSFVQDNPVYMASGYLATLQAMPEPLRSRMLKGDFGAGHEDHEQQVIPTDWVLKAQARWTAEAPSHWCDALGVDVARGGRDKTVITPRHGTWFGEQHVSPGASTPDGWAALQLIIQATPPGQRPQVKIDGIGVGSSVYDLALGSNLDAHAMIASQGSNARDKSGALGFANVRAEWWWNLREALDPLTGDDLAIPPDRELMADLTAPRWKPTVRGVQLETKDDIIERIGRSPDKGESLVYAHAEPNRPPRTHLI